MDMQAVLAILGIVILMTIGLFDVFAWTHGGPNNTVSAIIHKWSSNYPVLAFAAGFVTGHLFW